MEGWGWGSEIVENITPPLSFLKTIVAVGELFLLVAVVAVQLVVLPLQCPQLHVLLLTKVLEESAHRPEQQLPRLLEPRGHLRGTQHHADVGLPAEDVGRGETGTRCGSNPRLQTDKSLPTQQFVSILPLHHPRPTQTLYRHSEGPGGYDTSKEKVLHASAAETGDVCGSGPGTLTRQAMRISKLCVFQSQYSRLLIHLPHEGHLPHLLPLRQQPPTPQRQLTGSVIPTWQHQPIKQLLDSIFLPLHQIGSRTPDDGGNV